MANTQQDPTTSPSAARNLATFERGLLAYGTDFENWPAEAGIMARDLCTRDSDAAALYQLAAREECLIQESLAVPPLGGALVGSLLLGVINKTQHRTPRHVNRWWLSLASTGAACMFALGVAIAQYDLGFTDVMANGDLVSDMLNSDIEPQGLL